MPTPLIRPATASDIEECLALAPPPAAAPTRLGDDIGDADRLLLVAEASGRVVGYGRTTRFRPAADAPADSVPVGYYLVGLAVAPCFRRQGIGSALTRARLEWIGGRADDAWYFANAGNVASIALHARFGFREVSRAFSFPGVSFDTSEGILFRTDPRGW